VAQRIHQEQGHRQVVSLAEAPIDLNLEEEAVVDSSRRLAVVPKVPTEEGQKESHTMVQDYLRNGY